MNKRKVNLLLAILMITSMIMISTPRLAESQTPAIKIGAQGPLAITPGNDMRKGVLLAESEINANGGIDIDGTAHDVEIILETSSGTTGLPDATVASATLEKLILQDEVVAAIGGFRTEVVVAAIQSQLSGAGLPFLGVGSTAPIYTPFFWRVGPVNGSVLAKNVAGFYANLLVQNDISNVTIVREDALWTEAITGGLGLLLPGYADVLTDGNKTFNIDTTSVPPIPEDAGDAEVAAALDTLTNDPNVQAILTLFSAPVGKKVTEQWVAKGLSDSIILAGINVESQRSTHFLDTEGAAAGELELENLPPDVTPTAKSQAFIDAYSEEYGELPTYTSFASYDALYIIKEALERSSLTADDMSDLATVRAAIQANLIDTEFEGSYTTIKFTSEPVENQVGLLPPPLNESSGYDVHDLFTPSNGLVPGFPYGQPYFAQWLENGTKTAVWPNAQGTFIKSIIDPPYVPDIPETDTGPGTATRTQTETTQGTVTVTDRGLLFGFEIFASLLAIVSVYTIRSNRKHRKY